MLLGWLVSDNCERTKDYGRKLEYREFHINIRKRYAYCEEGLPGTGCPWSLWSLHLGHTKTQLVTALNRLLCLSLLWVTRLKKNISRADFLPQLFCGFSDWSILLSKRLNWKLMGSRNQNTGLNTVLQHVIGYFLFSFLHGCTWNIQWWNNWCILDFCH